MTRFALVFVATLFAVPAALACGGEECGESCPSAEAHVPSDDVDAAEGTKVTLAVEGLRCGRCALKVFGALKGLEGVHAAEVDADAGQARIAFDAETLDEAALIEAIGSVGPYTATSS